MALQNRVDPYGRIVSYPERGSFMGNRGGALHDDDRTIVREQASAAWLICRTEFKGRRRRIMTPGRYTELFFLDEATALAAGHRPCFECRRYAADDFMSRFRQVTGVAEARAGDIDRRLSAERRVPRSRGGAGKITFRADPATLPDGTMVVHGGAAHLLHGGRLSAWRPAGYAPATAVPDGEVAVLTPRTTVHVLASGYEPATALRPARSA